MTTRMKTTISVSTALVNMSKIQSGISLLANGQVSLIKTKRIVVVGQHFAKTCSLICKLNGQLAQLTLMLTFTTTTMKVAVTGCLLISLT